MHPKNRGGRSKALEIMSTSYQEYDMTAFTTVWLQMRGLLPELSDNEAKDRIFVTLRMFEFADKEIKVLLQKDTAHLSEGEKQRILVAGVISRRPKLAILDEPSGTLDPISMRKLGNGILRAKDSLGTTFLVITHDVDFASDVMQYVDTLDHGKIMYQGISPYKAVEAMRSVAKFKVEQVVPQEQLDEWRSLLRGVDFIEMK